MTATARNPFSRSAMRDRFTAWIPLPVAFAFLVTAAAPAAAFDLKTVIDKAQALAKQPYEAPKKIPDFMRELSYDQFRGIRFDPDQQLWAGSGSRFGVMLMVPGLFFTHSVKINIVDSTGVKSLAFNKGYFQSNDDALMKKLPADLGYAGFKLTFPLNTPKVHDQFLSFAGASYFRAVGAGDNFGISARGAALDTGLLSGEEFPDFIEYWLERPSAKADAMRIYALMNSKRLTGAYRFTVRPGAATRVDVQAVLFTRDQIPLLGIAPLTSMFYYGENTARPNGHWRPEVHDSDGLAIHNGTGEWLWNPLLNPSVLSTQGFNVDNVKGFGLLQRDRRFASYQDPEARYDNRPSTWVHTEGNWGKGRVMLIQIPTNSETNDNIVAFWSPPEAVPAGQQLRFAYRLDFGGADALDHAKDKTLGRAVDTHIGRGDLVGGGNAAGSYRVLIDFQGGKLDKLPADAAVGTAVTAQEGGQIIEQFVTYVAPSKVWRLSILARPAKDKPLALRAALRQDDQALTETWTYTLPQDNSFSEHAP